jgi:hypothetical protein
MAVEVMLPEIPRVHYLLVIPWWTVRLDLILLSTSRTRFGAKSAGAVWSSHRSSQNSVVVPSPNSVYVDAWKKARTYGSASMGSWLQACEESVFYSHSHRVCSA